MYKEKSRRLKMEPCGTPHVISVDDDVTSGAGPRAVGKERGRWSK